MTWPVAGQTGDMPVRYHTSLAFPVPVAYNPRHGGFWNHAGGPYGCSVDSFAFSAVSSDASSYSFGDTGRGVKDSRCSSRPLECALLSTTPMSLASSGMS
jgi:hypothetical protein